MYQPRTAPAVGGSGTALGVGTVLTLAPFTLSLASTCGCRLVRFGIPAKPIGGVAPVGGS